MIELFAQFSKNVTALFFGFIDNASLKIIALIIFLITYVGLLAFSKYRSYIAFGSAVIFIALNILPLDKVFSVVNWNLLLMLAGIMGTVWLFNESNMPSKIGDAIIAKTSNLKWAYIVLGLFSGIVSAFVDNVATVLILAPIVITISKKSNLSPVVPLIVVSIMSNLQGAATLVGDTTSILLGAYADLNFFDFFFFQGKPGLFWVIQISMGLSVFFLLYLFRKNTQKIKLDSDVKVTSIVPTILLLLTIVCLIIASVLPFDFEYTNGIICITLFLVGAIHAAMKNKDKKQLVDATLKGVDFLTLLLIGSLFVIIGGIQNVGIIDDIADFFISLSDNIFIIYTALVFASVLLSAFIDNIPYVAAMLPVASGIAAALGVEPYLLYFGLICGATLGGNLTPIGASANITTIGILRKEGYKVGLGEFMKISIPFTLITVLSGYGMIWFLWR